MTNEINTVDVISTVNKPLTARSIFQSDPNEIGLNRKSLQPKNPIFARIT